MLLNVTELSTAWLVDLQPCRAFDSLQRCSKDDYEIFRLERWEGVPYKRGRLG